MNLWTELHITTLDHHDPVGGIIPVDELKQLQQAHDIIESARQRAVEFLQQARRQRQDQRQRFRRRLAQQRRGWQKKYLQRFAQAKEEGRQAALVWLIEQQCWERQVYQRLTQNIGELLSRRLREISPRFPWETLLYEHLVPLCDELHEQAPLILKVAPVLYDRLPAEVVALPLQIEQDASLLPGDALLESPVLRIELKLPGQIEHLCEMLKTLRWEQLHESD
ncbi:hypothetical protein ACQYE5_003056 [Enterobacter cancerogenus]